MVMENSCLGNGFIPRQLFFVGHNRHLALHHQNRQTPPTQMAPATALHPRHLPCHPRIPPLNHWHHRHPRSFWQSRTFPPPHSRHHSSHPHHHQRRQCQPNSPQPTLGQTPPPHHQRHSLFCLRLGFLDRLARCPKIFTLTTIYLNHRREIVGWAKAHRQSHCQPKSSSGLLPTL